MSVWHWPFVFAILVPTLGSMMVRLDHGYHGIKRESKVMKHTWYGCPERLAQLFTLPLLGKPAENEKCLLCLSMSEIVLGAWWALLYGDSLRLDN